jgi:hypothetical protein
MNASDLLKQSKRVMFETKLKHFITAKLTQSRLVMTA